MLFDQAWVSKVVLVFGACPSHRIKATAVAAVSYPQSAAQRG